MMIALLVFGISCFIFLGLFIYTQNTHKHIASTIFKGLASICFFLLPIVGLVIEKAKIDITPTICLFIGLGLGVIGDVMLNVRDLFKKPAKDYISLVGVISFFVGHLFYLIHLFMIIGLKSYIRKDLVFIPILGAALITLVIANFINLYIDKSKNLKIIAYVYVSIISLLVTFALYNAFNLLEGYEAHNKYFITMLIGCFAFAMSDVVLIFNSFGRHPRPWVSALNLCLYYSGQLLIASSIILFYI